MIRWSFEIDKHAVCIFVEKMPDGSNRVLGTGFFFLRRDLVLTTRRTLEAVVTDQRPIFVANGSEEGKLIGARPTFFWGHPEVDLALVKVAREGLLIDRPLYPSHVPLNPQDGAIVLGYKPSQSRSEENAWMIEANAIQTFGVRREVRGHLEELVLEFDAPWMEPGHEGGPVILPGGGVCAVVTQVGAATKTARATSVFPILQSLRSPLDWFGPEGSGTHIHLDDRGVAWIGDTNVKVIEVVLDKLAWGMSPEEIHEGHPHLSMARIHAALSYYHDHKAEFDAEIERQDREYREMRAQAKDQPTREQLLEKARAKGISL